MNQPSRCNTQEGLLSVAQTGWLWSPGRQSTPNSKLGELLWAKKPHYQHITYGLQSDWLHVYKAILLVQLRGLLFKLKAILLVQTGVGFCSNLGARGLFSSPAGFLLGAYWLAGSRSPDGGGESHHFTGNRNPSPGCLPAPAPAAPHNETYSSASKTNKKKYQTHEL